VTEHELAYPSLISSSKDNFYELFLRMKKLRALMTRVIKSIDTALSLKVHKNENFSGFDFELCTICIFFHWAIYLWGEVRLFRIVVSPSLMVQQKKINILIFEQS
jgi:hypothetical protein